MRVLRSLGLRVRSLCRRSQTEANLNDELQDYIARQTEQHIVSRLSPEHAYRAALHDAGGIEQVKEECRDVRGTVWLENTLHDVWYGFRSMRRHRTFAKPGSQRRLVLQIQAKVGLLKQRLTFIRDLIDELSAIRLTGPGRDRKLYLNKIVWR